MGALFSQNEERFDSYARYAQPARPPSSYSQQPASSYASSASFAYSTGQAVPSQPTASRPAVPTASVPTTTRPAVAPSVVSIATSAHTVVSHAHGRQRRMERGIEKRDLQEALKYGRKERANPGRDGTPRWRYTHKGVVYITDESSRHEITCWRLEDGLGPAPAALHDAAGGGGTAHVVLVVDMSGSMRKGDVPGYSSRSAAVYECLARDLVEPQLGAQGTAAALADVQVSLIEMRDRAEVVRQRVPLDASLLTFLRARAHTRAHHPGNYLPALDAAITMLKQDAAANSKLFLLFLSDGAPSDHTDMECPHGVAVWQPDPNALGRSSGMAALRKCPVSPQACPFAVQHSVHTECVGKIRALCDLVGRNRLYVGTVAFGPPKESYKVLEAMAAAAKPRSSFMKLGLNAAALRGAFTTLTSTLTSLRTEAGPGLTLRTDIAATGARVVYSEWVVLQHGVGWNMYCGPFKCLGKRRWDPAACGMVDVPLSSTYSTGSSISTGGTGLRGLAHAQHKFAEGAERVVFQCTEVVSYDGGRSGYSVGPRLVAKGPRHQEHLSSSSSFHRTFLRTQCEAEELAEQFNKRLKGPAAWQVHFLSCALYRLADACFPGGTVEILVEQELEGQYTKWNNNAGAVARGMRGLTLSDKTGLTGSLWEQPIAEDEEGEGEEDEDEDEGYSGSGHAARMAEHVPQAFSHFTWEVTGRTRLVCDLQGVWNATDGYTLTDPVIHHHSGTRHNGATDKGRDGMRDFFRTHTCNPLCRMLGLSAPPKFI